MDTSDDEDPDERGLEGVDIDDPHVADIAALPSWDQDSDDDRGASQPAHGGSADAGMPGLLPVSGALAGVAPGGVGPPKNAGGGGPGGGSGAGAAPRDESPGPARAGHGGPPAPEPAAEVLLFDDDEDSWGGWYNALIDKTSGRPPLRDGANHRFRTAMPMPPRTSLPMGTPAALPPSGSFGTTRSWSSSSSLRTLGCRGRRHRPRL